MQVSSESIPDFRRSHPMPIRVLLILASILAYHVPAAHSQVVRKVLTREDFYNLDSPTSPVVSSTGDRLVYIRQWNDRATKQTRSSLWLVEGDREKAKA